MVRNRSARRARARADSRAKTRAARQAARQANAPDRVLARAQARLEARSAAQPQPQPQPSTQPADLTPAEVGGLYEAIRQWLHAELKAKGFSRPFVKRVAFLVTGFLRAPSAKRGDLVFALENLALSPATHDSISRRIAHILADPRLDPTSVLPAILAGPIQVLLSRLVAEHELSQRHDPRHAQEFPYLRIIIDESTKLDQVHILVAGFAYQGIVIPVAIRVWRQNLPLEPGEYKTHLVSLLASVQTFIPPVLREHVLLLADRAYGRHDFIDLLDGLDWHWVIRIQGQTRIKLDDETTALARTFAAEPGAIWCSGFNPPEWPQAVAAFKESGWRACQFLAVWAPEAESPWLLITNLTASKARLLDYAARWAIERLFLSWKSHGWDLESLRESAPERLGRYLSVIAIATLWNVAAGVAATTETIEATQQRQAARRQAAPANRPQSQGFIQLRLPFAEPEPDRRPFIAKYSLFTWGRQRFANLPCQTKTPSIIWTLPHWEAPPWSIHCQNLLASQLA